MAKKYNDDDTGIYVFTHTTTTTVCCPQPNSFAFSHFFLPIFLWLWHAWRVSGPVTATTRVGSW